MKRIRHTTENYRSSNVNIIWSEKIGSPNKLHLWQNCTLPFFFFLSLSVLLFQEFSLLCFKIGVLENTHTHTWSGPKHVRTKHNNPSKTNEVKLCTTESLNVTTWLQTIHQLSRHLLLTGVFSRDLNELGWILLWNIPLISSNLHL